MISGKTFDAACAVFSGLSKEKEIYTSPSVTSFKRTKIVLVKQQKISRNSKFSYLFFVLCAFERTKNSGRAQRGKIFIRSFVKGEAIIRLL